MSAALSWASPTTSSSQAIAWLNFGGARPLPARTAPVGRSRLDLVSGRHQPTTAGMQIRKIVALLERGRLARRALGRLRTELETYLERRLAACRPGSDLHDGLDGLRRAAALLGRAPAEEVERLVRQAEEQIACCC